MNKIIGNKELFAVEIEISKYKPDLTGKVYVWIDNVRLGVCEEENLILPHLNALNLLEQRVKNLTNQEFDALSADELFKRVFEGSDQDHRHNFTLGEAFDDFDMIAYSTGQDVVICVKLSDEPFFEYKDFPKLPIRKAIPLAKFRRTIEQTIKAPEDLMG